MTNFSAFIGHLDVEVGDPIGVDDIDEQLDAAGDESWWDDAGSDADVRCDGCGSTDVVDCIGGTHFHCAGCAELVLLMFEDDMAAEFQAG
jgi:hypothetical protein